MTWIVPIHFVYGGAIISRELLKQSICQRHCVYFTILAAAIDYNQWFVDDSRKLERYVHFRKAIVALPF